MSAPLLLRYYFLLHMYLSAATKLRELAPCVSLTLRDIA